MCPCCPPSGPRWTHRVGLTAAHSGWSFPPVPSQFLCLKIKRCVSRMEVAPLRTVKLREVSRLDSLGVRCVSMVTLQPKRGPSVIAHGSLTVCRRGRALAPPLDVESSLPQVNCHPLFVPSLFLLCPSLSCAFPLCAVPPFPSPCQARRRKERVPRLRRVPTHPPTASWGARALQPLPR